MLLEDYRDLRGRYDRLVSVEMIEAVGWQHFDEFFRRCSELLSPDGLMLLQAITIDDRLYEVEKAARSFANTHVFPGGCLPSNELIADCLARVTDMREVWMDDITAHYPPTLAAWRERFLAAWERLRDRGYDERFRRLWAFYLCSSEAGFRERRIGDVQLLLRQAGVAVSAGSGGASRCCCSTASAARSGSGARCSTCSRPSATRSRSTCRASAPSRRCRAGRAERRQPRRGGARALRSSSGSSGPTSPATRSAAGSRWRWDGPAGPPR